MTAKPPANTVPAPRADQVIKELRVAVSTASSISQLVLTNSAFPSGIASTTRSIILTERKGACANIKPVRRQLCC